MLPIVPHDEIIAVRNGNRIGKRTFIVERQIVDIRFIQNRAINGDRAIIKIDVERFAAHGNDSLDQTLFCGDCGKSLSLNQIAVFIECMRGIVVNDDNIAPFRRV